MFRINIKKFRNKDARFLYSSLGIVFLVVATLIANDEISGNTRSRWIVSDNSSVTTMEKRSIANVANDQDQDINWEHRLAALLASPEMRQREPASAGQKATAIDQIRFGLLAGKYHLEQTSDNKLKSIEYISSEPQSESPEHPVYVDKDVFLKKLRKLLVTDFDRYIPIENKDGVQSFDLIGKDNTAVGRAQFTFDKEGRFISLRLADLH